MSWDVSSFVSGFSGALIGGLLVFLVAIVARRRAQKRSRQETVELIGSELLSLTQTLLTDEVAREAEMTPTTRLQLARVANLVTSLRQYDGGHGRYVSAWTSRALGALLTSPDPAERPRVANRMTEALQAWDEGQRSWKWFRDDPAQRDWEQSAPDEWSDELDQRLRGSE